MRGLIAVVVVIGGIAVLGLYMGWFHVGTESGADTSKVTITVDKEKIEQDKDKAMVKAKSLESQAAKAMDKNSGPATQSVAR